MKVKTRAVLAAQKLKQMLISDRFVIFLDEITASFRRFGHLIVDWPHKAESKSYFPPKGQSEQLAYLC